MAWRWRSVLAEALANVASAGVRTASIIVITASVFGAVAFLELRTANDLLGFVKEFERSGGYVVIVVPAEGSTVEASKCEALNGRSFVVSAGSLRSTELVSFASAPGVLFQRATVSSSILGVWAPDTYVPPGDGAPALVVGSALAEELGVRAGSYLQPEGDAPARIIAVIDTEQRNPQSSRWALDVAPPVGAVEACWVEMKRDAYDAGLAALPAMFADGEEAPIIRPFRRQDEFTRDPAAEFRARPQRLGWLAASGLVIATLWLTTWFRRSELGLYLALGTDRSTLAMMLAVEATVVVAAAYLLGVTYAFAVDVALNHEPIYSTSLLAVRTSLSAALLALALAPLGAFLFVRGTIAELLKDR